MLCDRIGIKYIHVRNLGTPKEMMEEKSLHGEYNMEAYKKHLLRECERELLELCDIVSNNSTCLLCYENDAMTCHRSVVADRVIEMMSDKFNITHLLNNSQNILTA